MHPLTVYVVWVSQALHELEVVLEAGGVAAPELSLPQTPAGDGWGKRVGKGSSSM